MITYIIQVSFCWVFFYLVYHAFLRKETFFSINRWYLMSTLILSLFIPQIGMMLKDWFFTTPIDAGALVYFISEAPVMIDEAMTGGSSSSINLMELGLGIAYLIGIVISGSRLFHGLKRIYILYRNGSKTKKSDFVLIETMSVHLPFSFFHYVFLSKKLPLNENLEKIIKHEISHVEALHSLDIILLELLHVIFWFNPILILYKKAIRQSHEYHADAYVLRDATIKNYGQILLGQSSSGLEVALANQFFNSQIKKRIAMMYQKKSSRGALVKYLAAIPVLIFMAFIFSNAKDAPADIIPSLDIVSTIISSQDTVPPPPPPKPPVPPKPPKAEPAPPPPPPPPPAPPKPPVAPKPNAAPSPPTAPVAPTAPKATPASPPPPPPPPLPQVAKEKKVETASSTYSQDEKEVFTEVEKMPRFPGCEAVNGNDAEREECSKQKLLQFIYNNLTYPEEAKKGGIEGTVIVQFVVNKDGSVSNINLLRDIGSGCGEVSKNVVAKMNDMEEKWIPGEQRGKKVNVQYTLPIKFKLGKGSNSEKPEGKVENKLQIHEKDGKIKISNLSNSEQPLFILDGKEITPGPDTELNPDDIEKIDVLKGEKAIEKYGKKAANGVVEITSKKKSKGKTHLKVSLNQDPSSLSNGKPLIVIDGVIKGRGVEITEGISPDDIESMSVFKDDKAIKEYGTNGKEGVIEIITKKRSPSQVVQEADIMPRFPGCEDMDGSDKEKEDCAKKKLLKFVYTNLVYPEEARKAGIQGMNVVSFVVRKDGSMDDINILRSIGGGTDETVLSMMDKMMAMQEKWTPGINEGKKVDVQYTLPIKFKLDNDKKKH